MPVRKRMPRRRYRKGKGRKMALKRAITNKNQNTFSTACRWEAGIGLSTGDGQKILNYTYLTTSALSGQAQVALTREFAVYSKIFDQYRITGVSLKFIPRASVQSVNEVNVQTVTSGIPTTQVMYSAWDQDSPIPSSTAVIQTMRSTRKHDYLKGFRRSFRYTYKDNSWLDTGVTYDVTPQVSGWVSKGLYGNFGFYAENLPFIPGNGNPIIGQVEVIYHVVFRGQRLVNVSQTEEGLITLGNPEPTMKPTSELEVHSGLKDPLDDNECDLDVPAPLGLK